MRSREGGKQSACSRATARRSPSLRTSRVHFSCTGGGTTTGPFLSSSSCCCSAMASSVSSALPLSDSCCTQMRHCQLMALMRMMRPHGNMHNFHNGAVETGLKTDWRYASFRMVYKPKRLPRLAGQGTAELCNLPDHRLQAGVRLLRRAGATTPLSDRGAGCAPATCLLWQACLCCA